MDVRTVESVAEAAGKLGYKVLDMSVGKTLVDVSERLFNETLKAVNSDSPLNKVAVRAGIIPSKSTEPYEKTDLDPDRLVRNFVETRSIHLSRPAVVAQARSFGMVKDLTLEKFGQEYVRPDVVRLIGGANDGQMARAYVPDGEQVRFDKNPQKIQMELLD